MKISPLVLGIGSLVVVGGVISIVIYKNYSKNKQKKSSSRSSSDSSTTATSSAKKPILAINKDLRISVQSVGIKKGV